MRVPVRIYNHVDIAGLRNPYDLLWPALHRPAKDAVARVVEVSRSSAGAGANGTAVAGKAEKKGADYVVFDRQPTQTFSKDAIARATGAKMKLEQFYKVAVESAIERNNRYVRFRFRVSSLGFGIHV